MSSSPLGDAFAHNVWATTRVLDACLSLTPEQLETNVAGTYGTILDTLRHLVGSDSWYLLQMTGDPARAIDEDHMDLHELRSAIEADGAAWSALLAGNPDPDANIEEVDEDSGFRFAAPYGIRLAQALHHGTDHRSQICTALTTLGLEPPAIDVWDYGMDSGRSVETPPAD